MKFFKICLLICYLLVLFFLLFINVGSTDRSTYYKHREIHLVPFSNTIKSIKTVLYNKVDTVHNPHYWYIVFRNIIGNIVLFIPWGLLFPVVLGQSVNSTRFFIFTFTTVLLVESIQYWMTIGIFDIDDIIFNLTGTLIGFSLSKRPIGV